MAHQIFDLTYFRSEPLYIQHNFTRGNYFLALEKVLLSFFWPFFFQTYSFGSKTNFL
jgi:hypothetical protein